MPRKATGTVTFATASGTRESPLAQTSDHRSH
jgi:hypothetical protein